MKYVYALVSDESDLYLEECYLSVCSLLRHNSSAEIIVLVDDLTEKSLHIGNRCLLYNVASIRSIAFDDSVSKKIRSRLLKIGVREYIDGDFLYIDSDTMVCDNLLDVFECGFDVAMVLDHHEEISRNLAKTFYKNNEKITGFSAGFKDRHFNSGVMYVSDTAKAYEFFSLWKKMYYEGLKKGINTDQASLNGANSLCGGIIEELDGIWNVQLDYGLKYIGDAKILHYFNHKSNTGLDKYRDTIPYILYNRDVFEGLKNNMVMNDQIEELIDNPKSGILNARLISPDCVTYEIIGTYQYKIMRIIYVKLHLLYMFNERIINTFYLMINRVRKMIMGK